MTNLTEQWKKGELTGEYWCEITESPYPERVYLPTCDSNIIVKVLAEVPSYEEWKDIKDDLATCDKDLNNVCEQKEELYEENTKLKDLLKESQHIMKIEKDFSSCHFEKAKLEELLTKIDEVLK